MLAALPPRGDSSQRRHPLPATRGRSPSTRLRAIVAARVRFRTTTTAATFVVVALGGARVVVVENVLVIVLAIVVLMVVEAVACNIVVVAIAERFRETLAVFEDGFDR